MVSVHPSLAALFALCIWVVKYVAGSNCPEPLTAFINGRCCKQCPPGQYLEDFCTETRETLCRPCSNNSFSEKYNVFNKCTPCQLCQENEEKCSPAAKCLCRPGFLCSDDMCSECVKPSRHVGEEMEKTEKDAFCMILGIGYGILAVILLMILFHTCINVAKKNRAALTPAATPCHPRLSIMEERGLQQQQQLFIQADSKNQLQEIVTNLS
ncbi:tumor necrosis factor receptor superfamily member 5 [Syngnathus typhle]|uniref:tumor necrosis factor receptor superfamily member 5 n=1 Tax=Syngnathus typhle TaxID=161592 RepID=UPI002A6A59AE|nr:tumor necrosis factor receptor superfamily member 5 [Syngnathus typhle]